MFAITKIIGTGKDEDPYRADISGSDWQAIIPSNSDGTPKFNWCLVRLSDPNAAIGTELFKFSFGNLGEKDRVEIKNKLDNIGVDTTKLTLDTTLKEIINHIGKHLDSNFSALKEQF